MKHLSNTSVSNKVSDYNSSNFLLFFEGYISDLLDSFDPIVKDLAKDVVLSGGKRIRPFLVYTCGASNTEATENLLKASAVIEIVHVATLVHDDILDNARFRRALTPGDLLTIDVDVDRVRHGIWFYRCRATVDGELAVAADVTCGPGGHR